MSERHSSLEEGAAAATALLGFPVAPSDLAALVDLGVLPQVAPDTSSPARIRAADAFRLGAQAHALVEIGGLFDETPGLFPRAGSDMARLGRTLHPPVKRGRNDPVFLGLSPTIGLSYTPGVVPAEAVQLFIALLRSRQPPGASPPATRHPAHRPQSTSTRTPRSGRSEKRSRITSANCGRGRSEGRRQPVSRSALQPLRSTGTRRSSRRSSWQSPACICPRGAPSVT
jgi:hypothetical protein